VPPNQPTAASRLTFACCVESGTLEDGVIRLVESLRRFGGDLADVHVVAVTPRRGPSLRPETLRRFSELDVDYARVAPRNRYAWMPYLNKAFALAEAERHAAGDLVAWLDSDMLVLAPPNDLLLADDEDLAVCARDRNIGTTGYGDEFEPYWQKLCEIAGVDLDALPWVETTADHQRVRLYWNAGMFCYRPSTGFLDAWRSTVEKELDNTDASTLDKVFWVDQVSLGLAAVTHGMRFRNLPGSLNYGIASHFSDHLTPEGLAAAKILHYHDSMSPANWEWFLAQLDGPLSTVREWLEPQGPIRDQSDLVRRTLRDGYKAARQLRRRAWSRSHGAGVLGR
jgi:hypothetical protein